MFTLGLRYPEIALERRVRAFPRQAYSRKVQDSKDANMIGQVAGIPRQARRYPTRKMQGARNKQPLRWRFLECRELLLPSPTPQTT